MHLPGDPQSVQLRNATTTTTTIHDMFKRVTIIIIMIVGIQCAQTRQNSNVKKKMKQGYNLYKYTDKPKDEQYIDQQTN